jgi:hypothetical protein
LTSEFEFVDGGQTFFCTMEAPRHAGMPPWWWFRLESRDRNTRYAPFAASPKDTKESVKKRIIAYYTELLAIEARPVRPAYQRTWQKPVRPDAAAVAAPPGADNAAITVVPDVAPVSGQAAVPE